MLVRFGYVLLSLIVITFVILLYVLRDCGLVLRLLRFVGLGACGSLVVLFAFVFDFLGLVWFLCLFCFGLGFVGLLVSLYCLFDLL